MSAYTIFDVSNSFPRSLFIPMLTPYPCCGVNYSQFGSKKLKTFENYHTNRSSSFETILDGFLYNFSQYGFIWTTICHWYIAMGYISYVMFFDATKAKIDKSN